MLRQSKARHHLTFLYSFPSDAQCFDLPAGMYLTPRMGESPLEQVSCQVTKGWNGILFVHDGPYEGGVFKFKIDFPLKYPLNLPQVTFTQKQVYHPLVELPSGRLDLARLFEHPDSSYCDENYISGQLVHCYDGFAKELLSKIWNIFNNTLLVQSLL